MAAQDANVTRRRERFAMHSSNHSTNIWSGEAAAAASVMYKLTWCCIPNDMLRVKLQHAIHRKVTCRQHASGQHESVQLQPHVVPVRRHGHHSPHTETSQCYQTTRLVLQTSKTATILHVILSKADCLPFCSRMHTLPGLPTSNSSMSAVPSSSCTYRKCPRHGRPLSGVLLLPCLLPHPHFVICICYQRLPAIHRTQLFPHRPVKDTASTPSPDTS